MSAALFLLPVLGGLIGLVYVQTRNPLHPFFALISIFTILVLVNFLFAQPLGFYPLRLDGLGAVVLALTALSLGVVGATWAVPPDRAGARRRLARLVDADGALLLAVVLFALCLLANAFYWIEVQQRLGIGAVLARPASLKAAELSGYLALTNPIYLFRVNAVVPVALTMAAYLNPDRRLPKVMLAVALTLMLFQVRRDPIINLFAAALAVAIVAAPRLRGLALPLGIGLTAISAMGIGVLALLSTLPLPFGQILFGYTAALSSFQALLDGFYPEGPHQPLEYTLYVFYSLFKYVDEFVRPESIIRLNPAQPLLPNTYSFLADFYVDAGVAGLVIMPLLIGMLMAGACSLATRRPTLVTLSLFAAVYGAAAMSFVNNEWSWFMIPGTVFYAALCTVLLLAPCTVLARFWRPRLGVSIRPPDPRPDQPP